MTISSPAATQVAPHQWPVRVYYEDTDAAGVVYYATYLRYCERARTELLRDGGFSQHELLKTRALAFVVRSLNAAYRAPARLDDALEVITTVDRLGRASIVFRQHIEREGRVLFDATVSLACIDTNRRKPVGIPPDLIARLDPARHP